MDRVRRIAFFPDSYLEVNGVALTSRQLVAFAKRRGYPFFVLHAGPETRLSADGSVTEFELKRGPLSVQADADYWFDPLLWRYLERAEQALREFKPDLVHITGPSDVGILGVRLAFKLGVPIAASWHTNLHEYAGRRMGKLLGDSVARWAERRALDASLRYYRFGKLLYAPNEELAAMIERGTGRRTFLMRRGVDTILYSPEKRRRMDDAFTLGFVGRLTPEKNVQLLAKLEQAIVAAGQAEYKFLVCGQGSEREWLISNLRRAEIPGVLRGEDLARAYANMDLFVFPSWTDTFGNVVQEAMASGAPAIVTAGGGPKFIVEHGKTGFVARTDDEFIELTLKVMADKALHRRMSAAAREYALGVSWDSVFDQVYDKYDGFLAGRLDLRPAQAGLVTA